MCATFPAHHILLVRVVVLTVMTEDYCLVQCDALVVWWNVTTALGKRGTSIFMEETLLP
jgi:hypothetical protein